MARLCNDCPFYKMIHLEDDGPGLSKIHFKCTKTNTEVIVKVRRFNEGYVIHDCPFINEVEEIEDVITPDIEAEIQIEEYSEEISEDY